MKSLILVFLFCTPTLSISAQVKSNNNDLRNKREIFSIKEFKTDKQFIYKMETSISGQVNISFLESEKLLNNKKVDTGDAQKIDDEFVDKFISFKYIMKNRKKQKCKDTYFLSLRGEELVICSDEKDKIKIIKIFIDNLKNQFS